MYRRIKKDYKYLDDKGNNKVIPKESVQAVYYHFVLSTALDFSNPVFYFYNNPQFPEKNKNEDIESCPNFGFHVSPDLEMISTNLVNSNYLAAKEKSVNALPSMSKWKLKDKGRIKYLGDLNLRHAEKFAEFNYVNMISYPFMYGATCYFNYDVSKYIYNSATTEIIDSLHGMYPDRSESFMKYGTDKTTSSFNYKILEQGKLFGEFFYYIYVNQGTVILEVRNSKFQIVGVEELTNLANSDHITKGYIDFDAENLFVCGHTICYLAKDADKILLYKYDIIQNTYKL